MHMKTVLAWVIVLVFAVISCSAEETTPSFKSMNDPALLSYIEDTLYEELVSTLDSDQYFVENVTVIYISEEYLEEMEFNSQSNIFFGYTLKELGAQFQGDRYVFTLGANNGTVVERWEAYDDTYDRIIRNVAVGTGVILICVTVSVVTYGAGAPAVSMIFAVAAKSGTVCALSGAALGGVSAGVVTGIQTGDMDAALKSAALAGSEGFKWGAITGAITAGAGEAVALKGATLNGLTMNEAAIIQRQTNWPLDFIKNLHSTAEYEVYIKAGVEPIRLADGSWAFVKDVDWNLVDDFGRTNAQRILDYNLNPIDSTGQPFELHHVGQRADSPLAILSYAEHHNQETYKIIHYADEGKKVADSVWAAQKHEFWKMLYETQKGM